MARLPAFVRRLFRPRRPQWKALGWIAFSSLAWALCYPPFPLGPLAFLVLVPAFIATLRLAPRQAFAYHFAAGIVYNVVMYWWIYNVIKVGPALIIGGGLVLLILFLSLFNALLGWMFRVLAARPFGLLAYPVLWGGLEAVRTQGEMSFPWNDMGYALGHWNGMIQSASYLGIFGLSMAIVTVNCLAFAAVRAFKLFGMQAHETDGTIGTERAEGAERVDGADRGARNARGRLGFAAIGIAIAIPAFLAIQGAHSLSRPDPAAARALDISLVQPSIAQTKKWDEDYFNDVMLKTWNALDGSPKDSGIVKGSDLIVFAETAIPDFLRSRPELYERLMHTARATGSDVLVGALDYVPDPKPYHTYLFYNSAFLFTPDGHAPAPQYSKLRLVPFSERLPFDDVFPIINYVNLGEGDFSSGQDYAIWKRGGVPYAPSICYEIIYPDFVRGARRRGAELLVNITNDGWFGYSNAPFMHANISRFRAIETGAPIARCSNAGISVFYDYKGRVLGKTKLSEVSVLRRKVPIITRATWYLRHGDAVEGFLKWGFLPGLLLCGFLARRNGRRRASKPSVSLK